MPTARSDEEASAKITSSLDNGVEHGATKSLAEQCERVHKRVWELLKREPGTSRVREVQRQTRISLGVIGEALERYSPDELSFSYNGGKDCLVLLILYLAALHSYSIGERIPPTDTTNTNHDATRNSSHLLPPTLRSVYIISPNPFPAVTSFVNHSAQTYHLSLDRYHKPMKEAFASYLAHNPSVRAIFVGTRRTDPHGGSLTHFDPTTDDWPSFMRIHPVIDWHYRDIWAFIKEVGVEYCELYDMGYTSLGGTEDTHPNPALAVGVGSGEVRYRPAYELVEDEEERLGRDGGLKKVGSV